MKTLLLLFIPLLLFSCKKDELTYDRSTEWLVEAQSEIRVYYWQTPNGSEKVSYDVLRKGQSKSFKKQGDLNNTNYYALEVECLSSNCAFKVNAAPFSETTIFDKNF